MGMSLVLQVFGHKPNKNFDPMVELDDKSEDHQS